MEKRTFELKFTKIAQKDVEKVKKQKTLSKKLYSLLEIVKKNPFEPYPEYEKLLGDLKDKYSRRINRQHRLVYEVCEVEHVVKVLSVWTHYER